ncbi:MAG: hypothetical protein COV46_00705 [Deltaproteobacteria bacterium CG11_big_fil_rev_8_21_14_0_20_49_13]|nr:MAG: hypothetical protein COV46_00705 [Deltaproteobacteria bacterium CG11_big_fil_rev_8_21_14_0_20_49_13]
MGQGKKVIKVMAVIVLGLFMASCSADYWNPTKWFDSNDSDSSESADDAVEATSTYSVALGGVARGRDELVVYDDEENVVDFSDHSLTFETNNDNIVLVVREGFDDYMSGSGARISPQKVGTTIIRYFVDGVEGEDRYKVIVPPQSLIQILMGEAIGQIYSEAQVADWSVGLSSDSPTGNALAYVVKNRVDLIDAGQPFSLFIVDENVWDSNSPASHWDAVITAESSGTYQFSPVDPENESNKLYLASASRDNFTQNEYLVAYDQTVLTAAKIFGIDAADPTNGAFAFRTPTAGQTECLAETLKLGLAYLPYECGPGDESYPAFKPVQVLIHPSIALLSDGRPSFVFYRNRAEDEPAVTNAP